MPKPVFYRPSQRRRRLLIAAGVAALVGLVVTLTNGDGSDTPVATETSVPVEEALVHVHGLGVNPADAAVYVATHSGLFRLSGHGDATLVGRHRYDLMGFTVAGPDRFIASGHPDVAGMRDGLPGHLGVIESTDAGGTWETVALAGDADLHTMAYADGRAYAVDAVTGQLLVSDDLRTWAARGALPATALAVDPTNRDRVVAATQDGLRQSTDAGVTWQPLPGPALRLLAWDRTSGLWGVAADGSAYRRNPADADWSPLPGVPGEPQAATSDDGVRYVATHDDDRTVLYASDGADWRVIFDGT